MSAADIFWAAPPVSRTITAAAVLLSVPVWMNIIEPYVVVFYPAKIFTFRSLPQLWRLVTPFILTGPGMGMIFDPYFLYNYGSMLETEATRFTQPGDFFMYLVFVQVVVLLLGGLYLGGMMLLSPLTLALAYTYAQENPHRQISFFIVTFPAKWLPYAMLAMTFVMGSPGTALVQVSGLVAAHAYDFLTTIWPQYGGGRRLLSTPTVVRNWFAKPMGTATARGFGTAFSGQATGAQNARSTGTGSGFGGQGRRLGGS